jgi:hypothetical protein
LKNLFTSFFFPLILIGFTLVFWFFQFETSGNEPDRVLKAIQGDKILIQQDTNREKIYYQAQFVLAPEVLSYALPKDSSQRIDFEKVSNGQKFSLTILNQ